MRKPFRAQTILLLTLSFSILLSSFASVARAELISLQAQKVQVPRPGNAVEWFSNVPPFFIYQNDPSIPLEYFVVPPSEQTLPNGMIRFKTGYTNLCSPTAVSTALIYQKWFKPHPAASLNIPGLNNTQATIDPIQLLVQIVQNTGFYDSEKSLEIGALYSSAALYYRDAQLNNASIEMRGPQTRPVTSPLITQIEKNPNIGDIIEGLNSGRQVIVGVQNPHGRHEINVWGYFKTGDGNYSLYISDPAVNYLGPNYADHQHYEIISISEQNGVTTLSGFKNRNLTTRPQLTAIYTLKAN